LASWVRAGTLLQVHELGGRFLETTMDTENIRIFPDSDEYENGMML